MIGEAVLVVMVALIGYAFGSREARRLAYREKINDELRAYRDRYVELQRLARIISDTAVGKGDVRLDLDLSEKRHRAIGLLCKMLKVAPPRMDDEPQSNRRYTAKARN